MGIFQTIFYKPILNFLIFIYQTLPLHDFGVAIIFLTIIIKLILYPLSLKALKSQKILQEIQPQILEIKKKYRDKEKQSKEILAIYQKTGAKPFLGIILPIVQLPILIAIYQVIFKIAQGTETLDNLYFFIKKPFQLNTLLFGFFDLAKPNIFLAGLIAFFQFWQTKKTKIQKNISSPSEKRSEFLNVLEEAQNQMIYFFPFLSFLIVAFLPSAIALYLIISSIFSIIEKYFIEKKFKKIES